MSGQKKKKPTECFLDLSPAERAAAVKIFDKPLPESRVREMTKKEREQFERTFRRTPHVSIRVQNGKRTVLIDLDDELFRGVTAYARKHRTTLPHMIDRGLRGLLAFDDVDSPLSTHR